MTGEMFSDEILMRYADGELDAETAARIDEAMEVDETLAERLALYVDTRAGVRDAMRPLLEEPVPAALTASVQAMIDARRAPRDADGPRSETVVPFQPPAARRAPLRENPVRWALPLAASLAAAVVGGLVGFGLAARETPQPAGLIVAGISSPQVLAALAEVVSGQERELEPNGRRFRAIATFRNPRDAICREFEIDSPDRSTVISVACREAGDWNVAFAVVAPAAAEGYAPASSTDTLDAYLGAIEAGAPMEPADEAAALRTVAAGE